MCVRAAAKILYLILVQLLQCACSSQKTKWILDCITKDDAELGMRPLFKEALDSSSRLLNGLTRRCWLIFWEFPGDSVRLINCETTL